MLTMFRVRMRFCDRLETNSPAVSAVMRKELHTLSESGMTVRNVGQ